MLKQIQAEVAIWCGNKDMEVYYGHLGQTTRFTNAEDECSGDVAVGLQQMP